MSNRLYGPTAKKIFTNKILSDLTSFKTIFNYFSGFEASRTR